VRNPAGVEEFHKRFNVSRETMDRLCLYDDLLRKWNPAINLVSAATLPTLWSRHFTDSAQAYFIAARESGRWTDLGSGGGFPGAVVAILALEFSPRVHVTCIDSDIRKCEFIRTLSRDLEVPIDVHSRRIEDVPPQNAECVSARALAPLPRLLGFVHRHISETGIAVLHKSARAPAEIEASLELWRFGVERHPSISSPGSFILRIRGLDIG